MRGGVAEGYRDGREARTEIDSYFRFHNAERPHQAHDYWIPAEVFLSAPVEAINKGLVESPKAGCAHDRLPLRKADPILP